MTTPTNAATGYKITERENGPIRIREGAPDSLQTAKPAYDRMSTNTTANQSTERAGTHVIGATVYQ